MKKCFLILLLIISSCAQAANLDDVVDAIDRINAYVQATVSATADAIKNLLWEANPNLVATIVGNQEQGTANKNATADANTKSLTTTKAALRSTLINNSETFRLSSGLNASDTYGYVPQSQQARAQNPFTGAVTRPQIPTDNDTTFNFETLLGPSAYPNFVPQNLNQNPSYNFILLTSGAYEPASNLSLTQRRGKGRELTANEIRDLQSSPDYEAYQAALRAYIANQSVGLSNLYQIMQKRIPQPGLGDELRPDLERLKFTLPISQLQFEQYLATRRSQNQQWYEQMQAASPATVSRETLFVLAEIREQLFQMQQQNERLLATISVMQLQSNQANKADLEKIEQKLSEKLPKS